MSGLIPEVHITITEEAAMKYLGHYLIGKCLIVKIISLTRLDGLDYWAFTVEIPITLVPFMPLYGVFGFHVYDDGRVLQVSHEALKE